jgi:hypothetical protein
MDNRTLSYEGNLDPIWATIQQNDKYHMGMLVADDVGTGKSRVGAGFVIDRIEKGYKKILVVTTNEQNVNNLMNVEFPQVYSGRADENGMYITAPPKDFPAERVFLRGESFPEIKANKAPIPTFEKPTVYFVTSTEFEKFEPRIKELGIDALVVDEVHDYKNIGDTNRGLAWVDLHKDLINRNVSTLYLSATPGVDISDLQYLFGLKVWALDGFEDWIKVITGEKSPDQVKQMNNDKAVIQQWADAITQAREKINTIEEDKFVRGEARQVLTVGKVSTYKIVDRFYKADNYSFLIGEKEGPFTTDMASEAQAVILAAKVNSKLTGDLATYSRNDIYNIINDAQSEFASEFHQPTRDQITSLGAAGIREASDILNKKKSWGSKGVNVFEATLSAAHTEQIMRELKTTGSYMSRDISRTGVEFNPLEITPSPEQVAKLDQRINFYKKVYETWRKYGAMNEGPKATSARYGLSGDFQADIKRTLFDMRLPSVIDEANKAIANGEKVVISIVNVNEVNGETGNLVAALNKINTKSREKLGEGVYSDPVDIPEALVDVLMLRDELKDMPVLASPITMLQDAFGDRADFVIGETSPKARERAAYNFQHDKLDVIVISGAGKQGINLHDITGKRVHLIVADYEWSATKFKQELGRVDRTGEATAPKVTVVHSGSAAERKFIATISNRMAGLGATSKGSSGSTGTESLTEMFELSTAIDKMAVAATWEGLDNETKGMFLDHYFDDSNIPGAANKRGTLDSDARALKKFLLALQTINRDKANEIYDLYEAKRAELNGISTEEGASASLKTASHTGEIIRQVQLGDNLRLSEVRDAGGHKFAVLDGILTPHMNAVKGIVTVGDDIGLRYMLDGKAWMRWVEFYDPEKNQYVVGLKIKPTRIKEVGQYFHLKIGSQHTPDNAMVDLRAGDKIQLSGHENAKWELYIGHGGSREDKIVVEGARIKDKDVLMNNGASYSAIGNFFFVEAEKLQQFIKRFPIFNDEPPVPHDDTPLFQAADPRQRAGAYEQASGSSPDHGQVLEDGWTNYVRPLLSAMEEEAVATLGRRPLRMGGADDATQAALAKYLGEVNQDMAGAKLQTMRWGEIQRDEALLNYNRRYGFDKFLDVVFPYQFWYTRTMMNWALRALDRPAWLSNYARLRNVFSTFQSNTPARLQGKIAIPMPFLPAWMGGTLYVDPWGTIFPFVQFAQPFDQMTRDQMSQEASAGFLIQGWVADGTMDTYSGQQALQTHAGPAWDKAMAQASLDTQQEISNPFDFVRLMFGPAWYLSMPLNALGIKVPLLSTGNRQDISQLPLTRTAEAAQAVTEGTWAAPIGDILSVFAKPEEWIRGAAGLPKQGEYGDYYINRQLANMVGDGEISTNDATMAMIQRTGPAFDAAVKRVGVELAMRIPGAATLYAITHNTPLQEIAASIPVSLFGSQILPTGELKFRGQTDEWNQAWDRYNAGDTKAITAFFDKYPEYEAYIARKKAPEDLLRSFLTGQIWDKYMALSSGDKKMANAQMGNNFETAFLDSNTRDYTAIDLNTLAMWSRYLGGLVPNVKQTATTANTPDTQITMPTFLPENINVALKAYNGEKDARFPGISNIQSMYYALKPEQQAAFKIRFPEYGKYLAWRKEYISAHPAVRPFIDSYYAQDILSGKVNASEETKSLLKLFYSQDYQDPLYGAADYLKDASQTLWEQLFDYQLFKQQPSDAAMTELQIIWEASGRPGGTLRKFLDEIIMPTLQQ